MNGELHLLQAISPIDGRYRKDTAALASYFSEQALMQYRLKVEVLYFIALSKEAKIAGLGKLSAGSEKKLHAVYQQFSLDDAKRVKDIEGTTKHDVKAIEYFLKEKLKTTSLKNKLEFIHFALTSEDVNNLSYSLMLQDSIQQVYLPVLKTLITWLQQQAKQYKNLALLSLTHGQPATPTTLGKEYMVYAQRLSRQFQQLQHIELLGKFGGATGTWAAHQAAYPSIDWLKFAQKFIKSLGLTPNLATTQIEAHDTVVDVFQRVAHICSILKDLDQDMWLYISRKIFIQKNVAGELGSSAMPHNINPIFFENSEGNCGVAIALCNHFASTLPISRMQRDLTDSTLLRNQGVAIGHAYLAITNTMKAFQRLQPDTVHIADELNQHWEVVAEPIQTVLRSLGKATPYEQLKQLTRGHAVTKQDLHRFIDSLNLSSIVTQQLKKLTPANYIGLAPRVAGLSLK